MVMPNLNKGLSRLQYMRQAVLLIFKRTLSGLRVCFLKLPYHVLGKLARFMEILKDVSTPALT